jgi:hypothetical protein
MLMVFSVLRDSQAMSGLKMVEIHLTIVRRAVFPSCYALEEHAHCAPLLGLLLLLPSMMVVCHWSTTAVLVTSPTKPEVARGDLPLDEPARPPRIIVIITSEEKEAPTPVRRRRFEAEPRPSRESCMRRAHGCANGRSLTEAVRFLGILPNPIAIVTRDMF